MHIAICDDEEVYRKAVKNGSAISPHEKTKTMKRKILSIMISVILSIFLLGCDKDENHNANLQKERNWSADWKQKGFQLAAIDSIFETSGSSLEETGYQTFERPKVNFSYESCCYAMDIWQERLYCVHSYETESGWRYLLECDNVVTGDISINEINMNEDITGIVWAVDAISVDRIALLCMEAHKVILIDGDANCLLTITLPSEVLGKDTKDLEVLQQLFLHTGDSGFAPNLFAMDESNRLYIQTAKNADFFLLDDKGEVIKVEDYGDNISREISNSFHAVDGTVILIEGDVNEGKSQLFIYEGQGQRKTLGEIADAYVEQCYLSEEGYFYAIVNSKLLCWDLLEDKLEEKLHLLKSDLVSKSIESIQSDSEGRILFIIGDLKETEVYIFASSPENVSDTILITDLRGGDAAYIETCAASFTRLNRVTPVKFEKQNEDKEAFQNRALAELIEGNGADMYVVNDEQLRVLYEQGALMDLSEIISLQTRNQIPRGLLRAGTLNDTLLGICPDTYTYTLITADSLWSESEWNIQDIVKLLQENTYVDSMFTWYADYKAYEPDMNLGVLMLWDITNCQFIDLDKGSCSFDCDEFITILQATKKYSKEPQREGSGSQLVRSGAYLAMEKWIDNLSDYVQIRKEFPDCHRVNYPWQKDGESGFWCAGYYLVVNKQAKDKETIQKFFEYLLSKENQEHTTLGSIRKDVIKESLYWDEDFEQYAVRGQGVMELVDVETDGTEEMEEYLTYLDNCGYQYNAYSDITDIIYEEANSYFANQQTVEKTAELIQNRVQLYLNENR